jgi:hypothetical protein
VIRRAATAVLGGVLLAAPVAAQNDPKGPLVNEVRIEGASVYTQEELTSRHKIVPGTALPDSVDELASRIRRQYRRDDYALATVDASLDPATGTLTIRIDEGRFDAVDITGLPEDTRARLLDTLALHPGEIFNQSQANRALDEALSFAQGAIVRSEPTYTFVTDAGRRVLNVALRTRSNRTDVFFGSNGREDWYSPVDELNIGWGFHNTIFDRTKFNHTLLSGHVNYKTGAERAGYSFGIERPFFDEAILQVGASLHDLTATDDGWRLGDDEQSLVALAFRNTFRDYYRRKGYQLHVAVRPLNNQEVLVAWRDDRHFTLANTTDYGFFRDDHAFRPNARAVDADVRSIVVGYTYDTRGLGKQRPSERYSRHLLDDLFGERTDRDQGVRVDWRGELAPAAFEHDVDFRRYVATVRGWWEAAPRRLVSGRAIVGASHGALPPQRIFALGGIGSVRGYRFKETAGEGMLLLNGELRQGFSRHFAGLAFIDAGRIYDPRPGSTTDWLRGVGVGVELGDDNGPRVEFGWRLDDIPSSLQVLFRLRHTF